VLAKTLGSYGAPYSDARTAENAETDLSADEGNQICEDLAQSTVTATRAIVRFTTVSGGAPPFSIPTGNITHWTVWGSGSGTRPTITKTAQGRYTITFATSYTDGLGDSENVVFGDALAGATSSDAADWVDCSILTVANNIVTVKTFQENAALPVAHDVGNNSAAVFVASVWLR
jgi:hypothetical protein